MVCVNPVTHSRVWCLPDRPGGTTGFRSAQAGAGGPARPLVATRRRERATCAETPRVTRTARVPTARARAHAQAHGSCSEPPGRPQAVDRCTTVACRWLGSGAPPAASRWLRSGAPRWRADGRGVAHPRRRADGRGVTHHGGEQVVVQWRTTVASGWSWSDASRWRAGGCAMAHPGGVRARAVRASRSGRDARDLRAPRRAHHPSPGRTQHPPTDGVPVQGAGSTRAPAVGRLPATTRIARSR